MKNHSKGGRGKRSERRNAYVCVLKAAGIPNTHIARLYGISDERVVAIYKENSHRIPALTVIKALVDNGLAKV